MLQHFPKSISNQQKIFFRHEIVTQNFIPNFFEILLKNITISFLSRSFLATKVFLVQCYRTSHSYINIKSAKKLCKLIYIFGHIAEFSIFYIGNVKFLFFWWAVFKKQSKIKINAQNLILILKYIKKSSSPKDLKMWPEKWSLPSTSTLCKFSCLIWHFLYSYWKSLKSTLIHLIL